jgi:hypothetical protein
MTNPMVRPPLSVRGRRVWRIFRTQSPVFQAAAVVSAAVLVIGLVTAANGFSPSGSGSVALHQQGGGHGPGTGPGGRGRHGRHHHGGAGKGGTTGASTGAGAGSTGAAGSGSGTGAGGSSTGTSSFGTTGGSGKCAKLHLGSTDRGVSSNSIRVVYPWPQLSGVNRAVSGALGSSEDNQKAIRASVDWVNKHGGINCRMIDPEIVSYDPTNEPDMRAKCLHWTQDQKVFAVVDDFAWHDANQLCITQEGHTPLISSWTSTTSFLKKGAPYLWWAGPNGCDVLRNLVWWGVHTGRLSKSKPFGVVRSDSDADNSGYNECLLPALQRAGLSPAATAVLHYSEQPEPSAAAVPEATNFKLKNIQTVIPMMPFFQFTSWMQAEDSQKYYPRLLLSDYDSEVSLALAFVSFPYKKELQDQEGPTYGVFGNRDVPPYVSANANICDKAWHAENPPTSDKPAIEATGTMMTECQNTFLFAQAARMAGKNLTRAGFDNAMAHITNFGGGVVPSLSFSASNHAGPHLVRIVSVHDNKDHKCPPSSTGGVQGNCWLILKNYVEQRLE